MISGSLADVRRALSSTRWAPAQDHYHLQYWFEFDARAELALYAGDSQHMDKEVRTHVERIGRSMLLRVQPFRVDFHWLRSRPLMAPWPAQKPSRSQLREVERLARKLEGEGLGDAAVMARLVRAAIADQAADRPRALALLRDVMVAGEQQDMLLHAAVAQYRLGEMLAGDAGADLLARASKRLATQGVVDPEPMVQMIAPGFSPVGVGLLI